MVGISHGTPEVRFWRYTDKGGPQGCWLWKRKPHASGYGRHAISKNVIVYAHRFAWELHNGPIQAGLVIDHRVCRNKICVNSSHMVVCTELENWLQPDGMVGRLKAVTHCPKGHEYTSQNTMVYNNCRHCLACRKARSKCHQLMAA